MKNQEAYDILKSHREVSKFSTRIALSKALCLYEKYQCGYCDSIGEDKPKNKYGDYGRVCDNCYENLS